MYVQMHINSSRTVMRSDKLNSADCTREQSEAKSDVGTGEGCHSSDIAKTTTVSREQCKNRL